MNTFSALLVVCLGNHSYRYNGPVKQTFDVNVDILLNNNLVAGDGEMGCLYAY